MRMTTGVMCEIETFNIVMNMAMETVAFLTDDGMISKTYRARFPGKRQDQSGENEQNQQ